jgi:hypothetical protein
MSESIAPLAPEAIKELNEMLEDAKLKLFALEQHRNSDNQEVSQRRLLYNANSQAWGDLLGKLDKVTPVVFIGDDGTEEIIGTAGVMTNDLMLYYSPNENSRYTMNGYRLSAIKSFVKA